MLHALSLGVALYAIWVLLSGHYTPLLLGLGAVSAGLVVYLAHRMDMVDHEGQPLHLSWRILLYWPWLGWEIVKSNLDVARRIVDPRLPISPTMVRLTASQRTEMGRVIFANSITLTPGTVTVDMTDDTLTVHALSRSGAESLLDGTMDRKVSAVEGS